MRFRLALIFSTFALFMSANTIGQKRFGPNPLDTLGKDPSQSLGWEILQHSRSLMDLMGDYSYRFQLKIMPRREPTQYLSGVMVGSSNERGPVERIDVVLEEAKLTGDGNVTAPKILRLLLQNGPSPFAMKALSHQEGPPELIDSKSIFDPVASSTFSTFDLLRPFLYWQRFYYEGRTTLRRRVTHSFWMYPPEHDVTLSESVSGVRLFVDDQFKVIFKGQIYGPEKELIKTISITGLKKVDEEWILNSIEIRDEETKDKTRFRVLDASVGVGVAKEFFEPVALTQNIVGKRFLKEEETRFETVTPEAL